MTSPLLQALESPDAAPLDEMDDSQDLFEDPEDDSDLL